MKEKNKRNRILALVLCMILIVSQNTFIFAGETVAAPEVLQEVSAEPTVTEAPAAPAAPVVEEAPVATPEPTPEPVPTATEAPTPEPTPEPVPTVTEAPTPEPTAAPQPTAEPESGADIDSTQGAANTTENTETSPEGTLETEETYTQVLDYEDEEVRIFVEAKTADAIPENASLKVVPILLDDKETEEQYKEVEEELLKKAEEEEYEIAGFLAYDITFVDVDGNEVEPNGDIKVSMEYKKAVMPKEVKTEEKEVKNLDVTVMHLDENDLGEIEVVDMVADETIEAEVKITENAEVEKAEFVIEDSEVYTLTWTKEVTEEVVEEEITQILTYEDEEVSIRVEATAENAIPEHASLKVVPVLPEVEETSEQYAEVEKQLQQKAEKEAYEIAGFLAYDITFIDAEGNKVEPNGDVKVTMDYKKATLPEIVDTEDCENLDVTVMHLEEDAKGQVKEVVDMIAEENIEAEVKTTEKAEVEKAEFATNSFSVFTITWTRVDEAGLSFGDVKQEVQILYAEGTTYHSLDVNIGERPITSIGTPPTLYIDTITETGDNKDLYTVKKGEEEYRFVKAIVGTRENESKQVFKAKTNERVVAVQAIKTESNGSVHLRYMLENTGQYSEFETGDSLAFVYSNGAPTTKATYWTEDGTQLFGTQEFDFATPKEFQNEGGVEVLKPFTGIQIQFNDNIYSYVAITQFGDRIVPRYMRYYNGTLQYSMSEADQPREWHNVGDANIRLIYKPAHTVPTENTQGIVDINMFNYEFPSYNGGNAMGYVEGIYFGTGWECTTGEIYNQWTGNNEAANLALQGMVESELDNGYPRLARGIGTGRSLASLFDTSTSLTNATLGATKEVYEGLNHLFIKGTDGYYSFNSSENYAYYSAEGGNKNITIYDLAVDKAGGKSYGETSNRGDFMPFLPLGEPVADTANDESAYHLGMTIGFNFLQPKDSKINGKDMIFKFSGDDDVWVFIDGKLVLDIGGIHSEAGGSINFTTGEVKVYAGPIVDNGAYPESTPLAVQIDGSIKGSETSLKTIFNLPESQITFEPNTYHRLEFFYLERGADLSNCEIKFNLQPVKARNIEIEKQIINTDKANYGDIEFTFELHVENSIGSNTYDKIPEGTKYTLTRDGKVVGTEKVGPYGRFVLHHGESAIFEDINEALKYYVREVDVNDDEFDSVSVIYMDEAEKVLENIHTNVNPDNGNETPTSYIAKSEEVMVGDVYKMLFTNAYEPSDKRELHIQKLFDGDTKLVKDATFSFRVMLEDRDGKMVPYENGVYYLLDEKGDYISENGEPVEYLTSKDGEIEEIQVGQTIVIKNLMSGTDFYVEEIKLGNEYQTPAKTVVNSTDFSYGSSNKGSNVNADGFILVNKNAKVEITNSLKFDWEIMKVSSSVGTDGNPVPLEGAEFELKSVGGDTARVYKGTSVKNESGDAVVNWKDNDTDIGTKDIKPGTYKLTETKARAGYLLSTKEWTVVIDKTSISIIDGDIELAQVTQNEDGTIHYTITITNEPIYELPSTGGNGIYWYMIAGIILMMMAAAITYKNRRKEVLERYRIR